MMAFSTGPGSYLQGVVDPSSGSYRIQDVAPGVWNLTAHFSSMDMVTTPVEVGPGDTEVVQDLEFPSGFTLTGRVLLDRRPLPRALVMVHAAEPQGQGQMMGGGHRETAQDGSFRLERIQAGAYALRVMMSAGVLHAQTIEVGGDRDLLIEIVTGTVEGRLFSPEGLPVAGASVSLASEDLAAAFAAPGATSDDQGAFALPGIPAGTYRMTVRAEGFAPAESRVVVTPGGTAHVDLALAPP